MQILVNGSIPQPRFEVLLVSDRNGKALVFPKGGLMERDRNAKATAAREAMEEAGVRGSLRRLTARPTYTSKRHGKKVKGDNGVEVSNSPTSPQHALYQLFTKPTFPSYILINPGSTDPLASRETHILPIRI